MADDLCNMASQLQIQIHEINIYVVALTDRLCMKNPHSLQQLDNNIPMQSSVMFGQIFLESASLLRNRGPTISNFFFFSKIS